MLHIKNHYKSGVAMNNACSDDDNYYYQVQMEKIMRFYLNITINLVYVSKNDTFLDFNKATIPPF